MRNLAIALMLVLGASAYSQPTGTPLMKVNVAPSGICQKGDAPEIVMPLGTIWTCQNIAASGQGTWGVASGGAGGSGTVNSGTTGQIAVYGANGTAVSGTSAPVVWDAGGAVYNVKAYGALGNDTGCDDVHITSAITAAELLGGGTVAVPSGTYKFCSTVHVKNGIRIIGAGDNFCAGGAFGSLAGTCVDNQTGGYAFTVDSSQANEGYGFEISNLSIWNTNTVDGCYALLGQASGASPRAGQIANTSCANIGGSGLYITGTAFNEFSHNSFTCGTSANSIGIDIEPGGQYIEVSRFIDNNTQNCQKYGLNVAAGDLLYFQKIDTDGNYGTGVHLTQSYKLFFDGLNITSNSTTGPLLDLDGTTAVYEVSLHDTSFLMPSSTAGSVIMTAHGTNAAEAILDKYYVQVGTVPTAEFTTSGHGVIRFLNPTSTNTYSITGTPNSSFSNVSPFINGLSTLGVSGMGTYSVSFGGGAGTGPVDGGCLSGHQCDAFSGIEAITTGTSPATTQAIMTLTFTGATRQYAPNCTLLAQDTTAGITTALYSSGSTTNTIVFTAGNPGLTASHGYNLSWICGGA